MRLIRVDPAQRMDRWYAVLTLRDLFGAWAVACFWGSRRTAYQRHRLIPCATEAEARALAERIVRRKIRRGYREAEG
jgi:predicted DNA-binding WGR domain protein